MSLRGIAIGYATGQPLMVGSLTVNQPSANAPAPTTGAVIQAFGNETWDQLANSVRLVGRRTNGTYALPSAVTSAQTILRLDATGYAGTGYPVNDPAILLAAATETWTDNANGTRWQFQVTKNGTIVQSAALTIENDGTIAFNAVFTVATLPAAATSNLRARTFVSDALSPVFGTAVNGGGTVLTPVYNDQITWRCG